MKYYNGGLPWGDLKEMRMDQVLIFNEKLARINREEDEANKRASQG